MTAKRLAASSVVFFGMLKNAGLLKSLTVTACIDCIKKSDGCQTDDEAIALIKWLLALDDLSKSMRFELVSNLCIQMPSGKTTSVIKFFLGYQGVRWFGQMRNSPPLPRECLPASISSAFKDTEMCECGLADMFDNQQATGTAIANEWWPTLYEWLSSRQHVSDIHRILVVIESVCNLPAEARGTVICDLNRIHDNDFE